LVIEDSSWLSVILEQTPYFKKFFNAETLVIESALSTNEETILLVGSKILTYVLKKGIIDPEKEKESLIRNKTQLESEIKRSEALLNNEAFLAKAPEAKLNQEKEKYQSYLKQYDIVVEKLKSYV
jgi:valyl-tRNA synthetase